jgi:hypothetical protein
MLQYYYEEEQKRTFRQDDKHGLEGTVVRDLSAVFSPSSEATHGIGMLGVMEFRMY